MNVQKVIKKVKCKATVCESPSSVPKGGNEDDATAQLAGAGVFSPQHMGFNLPNAT